MAIKNPQHDTLAEMTGQSRHSNIDVPPAIPQPDPAILWQTGLGGVQTGHHFQPRNDAFHRDVRTIKNRTQHPIDPHPCAQAFFMWLNMQIRRAPANRAAQQLVHQLYDRRFGCVFQQIACARSLVSQFQIKA